MGRRLPQVNEAAGALQSDTAAAGAAEKGKGLRSRGVKRASKSGDLIPPVSSPKAGEDAIKDASGGSLFDRIKSRLKKGEQQEDKGDNGEKAAQAFLHQDESTPLEQQMDTEAPRKGDLTAAIRLEAGRDKLLVNQRKITEKVRKILNAIEAQDTYLKNIALKIVSKKHQGVVIDLASKNGSGSMNSEHTGTLANLLGSKKKSEE